MNTPATNEYLFLFRGTNWSWTLSPEEMQRVSGQWMDWFKRLSEQGKVVGGRPLGDTGKIVSGKNGQTVSDGPFAESKEAIGGYFMLKVDSLDEAVAIAQQCPGLPYGIRVEVRPLMEACPVSGQAVPEIELAHAHA